MTTNQVTRRNMYFSVRNFVITNEATAKTIPFFTAKYSIFENELRAIQTWSEMQKDSITGIAKEKKKLKESLIKISADYSKMLAAIAKFANDDKLMDKIRFRISELRRMKDVELRDYAKIIYDNVSANIDKLTEYEITADTQKAYMDSINSYDAVLSTPRTEIAEKSQTTKRLSGLFDNADAALLELDFAIEAGQPKQPG
jgi:septal ring factor EnvC (AmiA/AmiB activator)